MKHMLGYDFVVFAYWGGGEGERPGERIREKVTTITRISIPHGSQREALAD